MGRVRQALGSGLATQQLCRPEQVTELLLVLMGPLLRLLLVLPHTLGRHQDSALNMPTLQRFPQVLRIALPLVLPVDPSLLAIFQTLLSLHTPGHHQDLALNMRTLRRCQEAMSWA